MPQEIATVKISQLPAVVGSLSTADIIPVVQAGITRKASVLQVLAGMNQATAAAQVSVVDVSVSGTLAILAGTYIQSAIITGNNGPVKVGFTAGAGDIIDDTIQTGVPLIYNALPDAFFPANDTIFFTGTFKIRLCLWLIGE